ncbi:PREDICTED: auxin-responsive protein IAA2-like [Prunus mume]|uniref:Auxin-responsive protein n=1 Tax=Prunus mume TaxID=102107 RepID=A0ABM0N662_PRUMU|nr:PREDICTED: auxin-responsive protein IAA2-like [Prunus mume]
MGQLYNKRSYVASEDKKLELRLGPPGEDQSLLSLGCIIINNNISHEPKRVCHETFKEKKEERESKWLTNSAPSSQCHQNPKPSHFQCPMISKPCTPGVAEFHNSDKKACSDPAIASEFTNPAAVHGSDQKSKTRIAQAAVVGWPPVRSSRKNLASSKSSFSKPPNSESPNEILQDGSSGKSDTNSKPHMFVKINMEGVPIGRKINLKAYDSYEKLSLAIDELFQGLLAAQRVCSDVEKEDKKGETKSITHGNGEYTLLYEDHEGDRMLVGDVPWNMFVSTAKRLRVLKSSELSTLKLSSSQHEKTPLDTPMVVGK